MRCSAAVTVGLVVLASAAGLARTRKPLGAACRVRTECIAGAVCWMGTCEVPGPCSARRVKARGEVVATLRPAYDARGYEIARETEGVGAERYRGQLSADGRRFLQRFWKSKEGSGPPDRIVDSRLDARGRLLSQLTYGPGGRKDGTLTVFHWKRAKGCLRAPATEYRGSSRGRVTGAVEMECDPQGHPRRSRSYSLESGRRVLVRETEFRYRDGRWAGRTDSARLSEGRTVRSAFTLVRDARGVVAGLDYDHGADGTVDEREIWDVSCWTVGPRGLTGGPRRLAPPTSTGETP